jgi:PIN domain nuclease of toxin-antitoxin system
LKLLLDTHALLWALQDDAKLSRRAAAALSEETAEVFVSAVSVMEIALKHRLGKLPEAARHVANWQSVLAEVDATPLAISLDHAALAGSLDISHKDPFDRLLIAQSLLDRLPLVSNEKLFDSFGVERLW